MKQKAACISPFLHLNSLSTRAEIVPEQIWNMKLPVGYIMRTGWSTLIGRGLYGIRELAPQT